MMLPGDVTTYVVACVVQAVTNLSSVVYQYGLAAALDRSGRLVAAVSGLLTIGNGLGPSLAAWIVTYQAAAMVGSLVLALNLIALCGFAIALRVLTSEQPA